MTSKTQSLKKNRSFKTFIGFELAITFASFLLAWFIGSYLYPLASSFFQTIGTLLPQPLTATGFQMAYITGAGIVWIASNSLLFFSGLRRL